MKKKLSIIAAMFLLVLFTLVNPARVSAASNYSMRTNVLYKYDITGNGRKDQLKLVTSSCGNGKNLFVYLNGKKMYTVPYNCGGVANTSYAGKLLVLSNGQKFLYIQGNASQSCGASMILRYQNGCIKKVLDFNYFYGNAATKQRALSVNASGNNINVTLQAYTKTVGTMKSNYTYSYGNGKLNLKTSSGKNISLAAKYFRSLKNIQTYSCPGSTAKAFVLKAGAKIQITNVRYTCGKLFFSAVQNGRTGWFAAGLGLLRF